MGQWNKNTVPKCKERQYSDEVLVTVKKGQCNIQCDDIDSYEYAVECPDYVKEDEDE